MVIISDPITTPPLSRPIAVFDAGIGSYAIVDLIRRRQPRRDIVYFADRAHFPYGRKSRAELAAIMRGTVDYLLQYRPEAIVLASNAPSIIVLDTLKSFCPVPIYGVAPPLKLALRRSSNGRAAIMGVTSMIESDELAAFVKTHSAEPEKVALIDASSMVELVESGTFLLDPDSTVRAVAHFLDQFAAKHPGIEVLTLSSTHLPWLRSFFEKARPSWLFLDPAEDVVAGLPLTTIGSGRTVALVSESADYKITDFARMLEKLNIDLPLTTVKPASSR